ncbi:hypothetical protein [Parasediminibacterium sp. JCM 36343]|uniref:hypothetical protein n=1 Tax=Parasediminibacterium sp. JCM 36343 TaxID=3374279 RepID=UPI00397DE4A5
MKTLLYITMFIFSSCNNQQSQSDKNQIIDTTAKIEKTNKIDNSKYYTDKDTIIIATELGDTLEYAKAGFNSIVDKHPEFFQSYPENPDQAYYNSNEKEEFGSEVGQDSYYEVYAYFLKQKNGIEKYAQQRKKLIDIYSNINSLFGHFEYGGTYFGHQSRRILGYAEYSIYLLPKKKEDIEKTYDISKQKELYIKSLRQLIDDESKIDFNTMGNDKIERTKELNKLVDELDRLITDTFYLRRVQEFHYGHYEYY